MAIIIKFKKFNESIEQGPIDFLYSLNNPEVDKLISTLNLNPTMDTVEDIILEIGGTIDEDKLQWVKNYLYKIVK